jgi:hypothetical protein
MSAFTPLEQALFKAIPLDEFASACRNAFSGQSGVILKQALCSIAHPYFAPVGKDALETYRKIGRADVVNLLLRYSEAEATPSTILSHEPRTTPETTIQPQAGKPSRKARLRTNGMGSTKEGSDSSVPTDDFSSGD